MNRRRTTFALCVLCAILSATVCSLAAAANGTTAYTCKKTGPVDEFTDSHCKNHGLGEYQHVAILENTRTEVQATNETTEGKFEVTKIRSTIAGINFEIQSSVVHTEGWLENKRDASGEHYVHGQGKHTLTAVTVTSPAGKGCKVKGGGIETNQFTVTTTGQEHGLKFQPLEGTVLAEFEVEGCSVAALNGSYKLTGSVKGTPEGATTKFTHIGTTGQGTLFLRGQKAGIEGSLAIKAKAPADQNFTLIAFTTAETPFDLTVLWPLTSSLGGTQSSIVEPRLTVRSRGRWK